MIIERTLELARLVNNGGKTRRERERDFWKTEKRNSTSSSSKNTLTLVCLYSIITIHQEPSRGKTALIELQPPCDHCSVKSGMTAWMTITGAYGLTVHRRP